MDFLIYMKDAVTRLDWKDPKILAVGLAFVALAYWKKWFQLILAVAVVATGKAIEFFYPEATGAFVADLTLPQVVYIVGAMLVIIVSFGQMVLGGR